MISAGNRMAPVLLLTAMAGGCGSSGSPASPSSSTATLRGTVTDPAGDSLSALPSVPISPDLVSATVEVTGGNLTVTVSFAPGTLSSTQTVWYAVLDTDENVNTGRPGVPAPVPGNFGDTGLLGVDYEIAAVYPRSSSQATIFRVTGAPPIQPTSVATAAVTFPSADTARVTVPLALLGNDDGRMRFKVVCQQWLTDSSTTITLAGGGMLDYMPSLGEAAGGVR
jgi:hypothetical protein